MRVFRRIKPKSKTCPVCQQSFTPKVKTQATCLNGDCAVKWLKDFNSPEAIEARVKKMKEDSRKHSWYERQLEVEINHICRLIDSGLTCISCQEVGRENAGHFHSVGSDNSIRFNLHNVHLQCYQCNVPKSGNSINYRRGLEMIYGVKYLDYVEYDLKRLYPEVKLSKQDLMTATKNAKDIKKELIKSTEKTPYSPARRIELRNQLNAEIGVYKKTFTI